MADTSTVQSNSTTVSSSASAAPKAAAPASSSSPSRGELLKKILMQQSFGLLMLRISLGATMIAYGVPKFMGGSQYLIRVGSAMQYLGINFGFEFFGLIEALIEVVGGFMIMVGAYYRFSCFFLAMAMIVATISQKAALPTPHTGVDFIMSALHPLSMAFIFISALFLGPGRLSAQRD